jgi:hypothetical protein
LLPGWSPDEEQYSLPEMGPNYKNNAQSALLPFLQDALQWAHGCVLSSEVKLPAEVWVRKKLPSLRHNTLTPELELELAITHVSG